MPITPYTSPIIRKLTIQRIASGLRQSDIAQMLHVAEKTISAWEQGRRFPDLSMLERWIAALGFVVKLEYVPNVEKESTELVIPTFNATIDGKPVNLQIHDIFIAPQNVVAVEKEKPIEMCGNSEYTIDRKPCILKKYHYIDIETRRCSSGNSPQILNSPMIVDITPDPNLSQMVQIN